MEQANYLKPDFLNQYFGANDAAKANFLVLFKASSAESIRNLAAAIKASNVDDVSMYSHNLSSALKYLGVYELSKIFGIIERECDAAPYDWQNIIKCYDESREIYADVINEINIFLDSQK